MYVANSATWDDMLATIFGDALSQYKLVPGSSGGSDEVRYRDSAWESAVDESARVESLAARARHVEDDDGDGCSALDFAGPSDDDTGGQVKSRTPSAARATTAVRADVGSLSRKLHC